MAEADLRQFMRDIATRHERVWREQADMLWRMLDELRDLRQENRAQTQALLRVLDRLENGGAQA
jgi:hypothetical protein